MESHPYSTEGQLKGSESPASAAPQQLDQSWAKGLCSRDFNDGLTKGMASVPKNTELPFKTTGQTKG